MNRVIPTVFATNKKDFALRFDKLVRISKHIQIDIMDGKLVKVRGIDLGDIPNLRKYGNKFEAHLMVKNPGEYTARLNEIGFRKIIFHYEAFWDVEKCIHLANKIKSLGIRAWIAINPETSVAKIVSLLEHVDGVLLMGVHPGREHQIISQRIYSKIAELRKRDRKVSIQIDGGVNARDIKLLRRAGADYFNSGSFISEANNPAKALKELERA